MVGDYLYCVDLERIMIIAVKSLFIKKGGLCVIEIINQTFFFLGSTISKGNINNIDYAISYI